MNQDEDKIIEESVRCKHSWNDCVVSYSLNCDICKRNEISTQKIGDYYKPKVKKNTKIPKYENQTGK